MSDLIDRQELIYSLECLPFYHEFWKAEGCEGLWESEAVVNRIKNMPPAQQWVSVTEGLPKDLEVVNITYINTEPTTYYDHIKGKPMVATAVYYRKRFYWYSVACVDVLGEYGADEWDEMDDSIEVKAWKPLPEPFKGGGDE